MNEPNPNAEPPARPIGADRDAAGRVLPGNTLAVTHGLDAVELPAQLAHLRDELFDFERASLVDEGDDDIPTRRRSLIAYRARLHRRVLQIDDAIDLKGLVDPRGRLRVAWLSKLESLVAACLRIDRELGLERGAKQVTSLAEVLNGHD
jgi:hypothetical protein